MCASKRVRILKSQNDWDSWSNIYPRKVKNTWTQEKAAFEILSRVLLHKSAQQRFALFRLASL